MTTQEFMQRLQLIFDAARLAPLPAEAHDRIRAAVEELAKERAEQDAPEHIPPAPPEG